MRHARMTSLRQQPGRRGKIMCALEYGVGLMFLLWLVWVWVDEVL